VKTCVGKIAESNAVISSTVPKKIVEEIDHRRKPLNLTRSKYAALMFARWEAQGFPAVSEPDRLMQIAAKAEGTPKTGKKTG